MSTTIDPTTLLQVDGSVIVGIFVFLTILEYTGRKPDSTLETKQKKEKSFVSYILYLSRICGDYFRVCILAYQAAQKPLLGLVCQYCNPLPYSINFLACVTVRAVKDSF